MSKEPGALQPVLGYAIVIQLMVGLVIFLLAKGFRFEFDLIWCIVFMPFVLLVSMIPVSIAGWGVREAVMVTAFSLVGVPSGETLVVSISYGLLVTLSGLPGGVVWLIGRRTSQFNTLKHCCPVN